MTALLINTATLELLKRSDAEDCTNRLTAWADILCPTENFIIITPEEKRSYSVFTQGEMEMLYRNTTGEQSNCLDYSKLIVKVMDLALAVPFDTDTIEQILETLGTKRTITPETIAVEEKTKLSDVFVGKTYKKPSRGVTRRVWDIADELGRTATIYDVRAIGLAEGINRSTIATQFNKWRKNVNEG